MTIQPRLVARRCRDLLDLRESYRERLASSGQSANLLRLVDLLFERLAISARGAADAIGFAFTSAQRNIDRLVEVGILVEATGRLRSRAYLAPEILEIIQRDDAISVEPTAD